MGRITDRMPALHWSASLAQPSPACVNNKVHTLLALQRSNRFCPSTPGPLVNPGSILPKVKNLHPSLNLATHLLRAMAASTWDLHRHELADQVQGA
jgi:hypothetical protein